MTYRNFSPFIFLILVSADILFAQYKTSLGVSLGYTSLNMSEVNSDLNAMYNFARSENLNIFANISLAYRFANAGQILESKNINAYIGESALIQEYGHGIEFDFSGLMIIAGVDFIIWENE